MAKRHRRQLDIFDISPLLVGLVLLVSLASGPTIKVLVVFVLVGGFVPFPCNLLSDPGKARWRLAVFASIHPTATVPASSRPQRHAVPSDSTGVWSGMAG